MSCFFVMPQSAGEVKINNWGTWLTKKKRDLVSKYGLYWSYTYEKSYLFAIFAFNLQSISPIKEQWLCHSQKLRFRPECFGFISNQSPPSLNLLEISNLMRGKSNQEGSQKKLGTVKMRSWPAKFFKCLKTNSVK